MSFPSNELFFLFNPCLSVAWVKCSALSIQSYSGFSRVILAKSSEYRVRTSAQVILNHTWFPWHNYSWYLWSNVPRWLNTHTPLRGSKHAQERELCISSWPPHSDRQSPWQNSRSNAMFSFPRLREIALPSTCYKFLFPSKPIRTLVARTQGSLKRHLI